MPRINITFAQVDLDMLDDERWLYNCSEGQQLLYIKLILLAGRLKNHIPLDYNFLHKRLNYQATAEQLREDLHHLLAIYPGMIMKPNFIYFKKFWKRYSYIRPSLRGEDGARPKIAQGKPTAQPSRAQKVPNRIEGNTSKDKGNKENNTSFNVSKYTAKDEVISILAQDFFKNISQAISIPKLKTHIKDALFRGVDKRLLQQTFNNPTKYGGQKIWDVIKDIEKPPPDPKHFVPNYGKIAPCELCGYGKNERDKACPTCKGDENRGKELKKIRESK